MPLNISGRWGRTHCFIKKIFIYRSLVQSDKTNKSLSRSVYVCVYFKAVKRGCILRNVECTVTDTSALSCSFADLTEESW